ncbi:MAG TPA: DUF4804 domain-containing protein [Candidatus Babeliales bacterium]|nr:DUF4804 domain-containing protein [Candidatus Babeliales bacterium]
MKALFFITFMSILTFNNLFCAEMNKQEADTFILLQKNYVQFKNDHCNIFPTLHKDFDGKNAGQDLYRIKKLVHFAEHTYPILHDKVKQLCTSFIHFKQQHGSEIEKTVYKNISLPSFIIRLLEKRPLTSISSSNERCEAVRLRNDPTKTTIEDLNFNYIGTHDEKAPLTLENYLSYDEMKIAALIGLSGLTLFINDGDRSNNGVEGEFEQKFFQHEGLYVGLVGARFEKPHKMEWQDIIITKEQNTKENGYGLHYCKNGLIGLWADVYGCKFPTYEEAKDHPDKYIQLDQKYFNIEVYKKRIELVITPFLREANLRGEQQNKKAYVHAVGLGTGTWAIHKKIQETAMITVYEEIIKKYHFPHISDIHFSWFGEATQSFAKPDETIIWKDKKKHKLLIQFSQRNPASKLVGTNDGKLLVACYPWDSNAYPGNEYWIYSRTTSGNPAAACCSNIAILQNILINPYIKENILKNYPSSS